VTAVTRQALVLVALVFGCSKAPSGSSAQPSLAVSGAPSPSSASSIGAAPEAQAPLAPPDAGVTTLLSGLKAGDQLGPARVVEVFGVNDGRIPVHIASGTSQGWLEISLRSEEPPPPVSTKLYSVYWTMRGNITDRMVDEAISAACVQLGERLQAVEEQTPPPSGLKKFPKPPPVAL
jgi:hypothetical protein